VDTLLLGGPDSGEESDVTRKSSSRSSRGVVMPVRDSGPRLDRTSIDRLFDALYTTKADGLAISPSIVESHGGRLWPAGNTPDGVVFQFTVSTGRAA
jgi:C4-dicarboxylate-specific signal transduction histidine kinase